MLGLAGFYVVYLVLLLAKVIEKTNTNVYELSEGSRIFFLVSACLIFIFNLNSLIINPKVSKNNQRS